MPPVRSPADACKQVEAMLLRQLLAASGAFKGSAIAGSQLQTDMFVEALADAVAKGGGLGIAPLLERQLDPEAAKKSPPHDAADAKPLSAHAAHPVTATPAESPAATTSGFGRRVDPIDGGVKFHTGVDLRGGEGSEIRAAADGIVKAAGPRGGYGNAVEIDHGNGVTTLYAHASALTVAPGTRVNAGEVVGAVGHTGRATGPHLHFEVRVEGRPVDPRRALNAYGIRADNTIGGKATDPALK